MSHAVGHRPSAAPTHTLVRALIDNIDRSLESSTHLRETRDFLEAIADHLKWYDELLHQLAVRSDLISNAELEAAIEFICQSVYILIEEIKGLCEGTTDRIPFVLATLLNHEFNQQFSTTTAPDSAARVGIAFCPISEANYWYLDVGGEISRVFESLDKRLRLLFSAYFDEFGIRKQPVFPPTLILIGFQYAMVDDILFNANLYHELGHHVFESRHVPGNAKAKLFSSEYRTNALSAIGKWLQSYDPKYATLGTSEREDALNTHVEVLLSWTSELFCDAFAIAACGPNYRFSSKDLVLPESQQRVFTRTHPAELLRQHEQTNLLKELRWHKPPASLTRSFAREVQEILSPILCTGSLVGEHWDLDELTGELGFPTQNAEMLVDMLIKLAPQIRSDARSCVADAPARAKEFWLLGDAVSRAFNHAIVPSTIILDRELPSSFDSHTTLLPNGKRRYHPRPSTVMNWARVLYQMNCSSLARVWPGTENGTAVTHNHMMQIRKRLSDWTRKAVADWLLFIGLNSDGSRS